MIKYFKKSWLFIFSLMFLTSCNNSVDLNKLPYKNRSFEKLPEKVKNAIIEYHFGKNEKDNITYNLNNPKEKLYYRNSSVVGIKKGKQKIRINNKSYFLSWDGNQSKLPFILYKDSLYFQFQKNFPMISNVEDLEGVNFKTIKINTSVK
ncbi:hypothetical protein [Aureivirga sp. CE67]|uniref:hypothetical protein n=1 Tax=Aureivirga sp. CE67 TaxID=1788983 RepID=UPI0018CA310B|nr:hypothetical protein [Aureivirga sp. CE67]